MTQTTATRMAASAEIIDLVGRFYRAASSGDADALSQMISHGPGVLAIGTDPQEWWTGHDELLRITKTQMEEMGGGMRLSAGSPVGYANADVGWAADRPTLPTPDGDFELRLTFVGHRECGVWKRVHLHFSIGVPNEEAVGRGLTV